MQQPEVVEHDQFALSELEPAVVLHLLDDFTQLPVVSVEFVSLLGWEVAQRCPVVDVVPKGPDASASCNRVRTVPVTST